MPLPRPTRVLLVLAAVATALVGTVVPASAATSTAATDTFTRTVSNGLGSANAGGLWSPADTSSTFPVGAGRARPATGAGSQLSGYLASTAIRDTDVAATVGTSALPRGGTVYLGVLARRSGTTEYTGRVLVPSTGAVRLELLAGGTSLRSAAVPGLTVAAGTGVRLRLQATGANPTTLRVKAWRAGTAEPAAWQLTASDSTPALQTAGAVGIRSTWARGRRTGRSSPRSTTSRPPR